MGANLGIECRRSLNPRAKNAGPAVSRQNRFEVSLGGIHGPSHGISLANMTKQRGEDSPSQPSDDDASPGEFIDKPTNLPGDQAKKPVPDKS